MKPRLGKSLHLLRNGTTQNDITKISNILDFPYKNPMKFMSILEILATDESFTPQDENRQEFLQKLKKTIIWSVLNDNDDFHYHGDTEKFQIPSNKTYIEILNLLYQYNIHLEDGAKSATSYKSELTLNLMYIHMHKPEDQLNIYYNIQNKPDNFSISSAAMPNDQDRIKASEHVAEVLREQGNISEAQFKELNKLLSNTENIDTAQAMLDIFREKNLDPHDILPTEFHIKIMRNLDTNEKLDKAKEIADIVKESAMDQDKKYRYLGQLFNRFDSYSISDANKQEEYVTHIQGIVSENIFADLQKRNTINKLQASVTAHLQKGTTITNLIEWMRVNELNLSVHQKESFDLITQTMERLTAENLGTNIVIRDDEPKIYDWRESKQISLKPEILIVEQGEHTAICIPEHTVAMNNGKNMVFSFSKAAGGLSQLDFTTKNNMKTAEKLSNGAVAYASPQTFASAIHISEVLSNRENLPKFVREIFAQTHNKGRGLIEKWEKYDDQGTTPEKGFHDPGSGKYLGERVEQTKLTVHVMKMHPKS